MHYVHNAELSIFTYLHNFILYPHTTEAQHEENMSRNPRSSTTQQGKKQRQQIKDKEVLSTLTRLSWPFTDFQQKNIAPCRPRRHSAFSMRWVQVVLLPRRPRCSLLLQHGAECRGHHGGGHGRSEGSQRVLGVFTRDVNALEVFLTCEDGRRRWTGEWPQGGFILLQCNIHGSLLPRDLALCGPCSPKSFKLRVKSFYIVCLLMWFVYKLHLSASWSPHLTSCK